MKKRSANFFWNSVVPNVYPHIGSYYRDVVAHDAAYLEFLTQVNLGNEEPHYTERGRTHEAFFYFENDGGGTHATVFSPVEFYERTRCFRPGYANYVRVKWDDMRNKWTIADIHMVKGESR